MPMVIRVRLTQDQREAWARLSRSRTRAPRVRERIEIIWRCDLGWSSPRIAEALGLHEQTVRKYVKAFLVGGGAALADRPRSGRPPQVRAADRDALEAVLDASAAGGRAWTLPQMVRWLATERGVTIRRGRLSVLLRHRRFRWKRTKRSVGHKQKDPERQVQAAADLATLQGEATRGVIDRLYLDARGFAPTLPTGYSWAGAGTRAIVRYEAPQGRRVNVGGALAPYGPRPRLVYASRLGKLDGAAFLHFIGQDVAGLPAAPAALPAGYRRARPGVIVLDNYSVHRSKLVQAARPALAAAGVSCY